MLSAHSLLVVCTIIPHAFAMAQHDVLVRAKPAVEDLHSHGDHWRSGNVNTPGYTWAPELKGCKCYSGEPKEFLKSQGCAYKCSQKESFAINNLGDCICCNKTPKKETCNSVAWITAGFVVYKRYSTPSPTPSPTAYPTSYPTAYPTPKPNTNCFRGQWQQGQPSGNSWVGWRYKVGNFASRDTCINKVMAKWPDAAAGALYLSKSGDCYGLDRIESIRKYNDREEDISQYYETCEFRRCIVTFYKGDVCTGRSMSVGGYYNRKSETKYVENAAVKDFPMKSVKLSRPCKEVKLVDDDDASWDKDDKIIEGRDRVICHKLSYDLESDVKGVYLTSK